MNKSLKIIVASLFLGTCSPQIIPPNEKPIITKNLEQTVEESPVKKIPKEDIPSQKTKQNLPCPEGMVIIYNLLKNGEKKNLFCIDKYEATVVDKKTGVPASPHYNPQIGEPSGPTIVMRSSAQWYFEKFSVLPVPEDALKKNPDLEKMGLHLMPPRGAEQYEYFEPMAVSVPGKIPAGNVTRYTAEIACQNADKDLCERKKWYKACVGPEGPVISPDKNPLKKEFPKFYPYGAKYKRGVCNVNLHIEWPPGQFKRSNDYQMRDPRIGRAIGKNKKPMKSKTDSFPNCTNEYGAVNMNGNVHEIIKEKTSRGRATFAGSHWGRYLVNEEHCGEATIGHGETYADYSVGFRCCKELDK